MSDAIRAHYAAHPDPSEALVPVAPGQLDRIDDQLQLAWAWARYRSCYRRFAAPRILDAGCGSGLGSLGLARLNPGARVLGVDLAEPALEVAQRRLEASRPALGSSTVRFRAHDLCTRLDGRDGPFDFIICRRVIHLVGDPLAVLRNLAAAADPRALLLLSVPSRAGRHVSRQLRRSLDVLCPGQTDPEILTASVRDLVGSLRPDHPLRRYVDLLGGPTVLNAASLAGDLLGPPGCDLELEELASWLGQAGWQFLYAASGRPWEPDRVFAGAVPDDLQARVARTDDLGRAVLRDVLDAPAALEDLCLFACLADHEPRLPAWPDRRAEQPEVVDALIPHATGLVAPLDPGSGPATPVLYRAVSGFIGPVDPVVDAMLRAVDGRRTCREILDAQPTPPTTQGAIQAGRDRWLELANRGFVILEPPDPRQSVDCVHLGPVLSRLDCPCPRLWLRACARHGTCSLDPIAPDDPRWTLREQARTALATGTSEIAACITCADYDAEE